MSLVCLDATAGAQPPEEPPAQDHTELAKQSQNPVVNLVSVPLQFNFNSGGGLGDRSSIVLNIQPVIPIEVNADWNVIARTIIPLLSVPDAVGDHDSGLGDLALELFVTPAQSGSFVWGIGPLFSFPTATLDEATTGSWGLGPAGLVLYMTGPWVLGVLATQTWTLADFGDDRDVNQLLVQPFANYNFGRGWAVASAPIITANWDDDDPWTIPIGGGLTWTTKIGSQAMTLGAQYYYNLERPDGGAKNQLRFVVSFLFPEKKPPASKQVASGQ